MSIKILLKSNETKFQRNLVCRRAKTYPKRDRFFSKIVASTADSITIKPFDSITSLYSRIKLAKQYSYLVPWKQIVLSVVLPVVPIRELQFIVTAAPAAGHAEVE